LIGRGYLLLRRAGSLWGIANAAVDTLVRQGDGAYRIATAGEAPATLVADEVLGVVPELRVWSNVSVLRRFWTEPLAGLAVHGELPVVVVDPGRPPHALQLAAGGGA
jgi:hypothetical protein